MSDDKGPVDRAFELFILAPVGLAASARELLPELVERGRQQLNNQVTMARVIGQFAVNQGGVEAGKALDRARQTAQQALEDLGVLGAEVPPSATPPPIVVEPPPPAARSTADVEGRADEVKAKLGTDVADAAEDALESVPDGPGLGSSSTALAITDYDSLSASQVVPRLVGLTVDELEAVYRYETAKRARKTILNRVEQLRAS